MSRAARIVVAAFGLLYPFTACADPEWFDTPEHHARLAAGDIIVVVPSPRGAKRDRIRAAVQIAAGPEAIWTVMTDCARAPSFVPGLKHCEVIEAAPDGSWEVLRHEVKYLWLWPRLRYVFRADYQRPHRLDFKHVGGDLEEQEGSWILQSLPESGQTIVGYEVYLDPGFIVPQSIVHRALAKDLPDVLSALRDRVQEKP